jgi:hypothetical protein
MLNCVKWYSYIYFEGAQCLQDIANYTQSYGYNIPEELDPLYHNSQDLSNAALQFIVYNLLLY